MAQQLSDILNTHLDKAARLRIQHKRARRFRWLVLVEFGILMLFCICLCPAALAAAIFLGADVSDAIDLDIFDRRFFYEDHILELVVLGADGEALYTVVEHPRTDEERDGLVRSVLSAADDAGLVVVQSVGNDMQDHLGTFFGGQPLMVSPRRADGALALREVERSGAEVSRTDKHCTIVLRQSQESRFLAGVGLLLMWPIGVWTAQGRAQLKVLWDTLSGKPPPHTTIEVEPHGLLITQSVGEHETLRFGVDSKELLTVAWGSQLSAGNSGARQQARLAVHGVRQSLQLPIFGLYPGPAVADLINHLLLDFWERYPEQGIPSTDASRARCPYCTTVYVFSSDSRCPNCGAPPIDLKADW